MRSHWRVFTDTKTPEKALKLLARLERKLEHECIDPQTEPYHKGGHVVSFDLEHQHESWSDTVVDILTCVQHGGYGLDIGGYIQEELDIVSSKTSIAGITMIHCYCRRKQQGNAT